MRFARSPFRPPWCDNASRDRRLLCRTLTRCKLPGSAAVPAAAAAARRGRRRRRRDSRLRCGESASTAAQSLFAMFPSQRSSKSRYTHHGLPRAEAMSATREEVVYRNIARTVALRGRRDMQYVRVKNSNTAYESAKPPDEASSRHPRRTLFVLLYIEQCGYLGRPWP